jgi:hypothetical protein
MRISLHPDMERNSFALCILYISQELKQRECALVKLPCSLLQSSECKLEDMQELCKVPVSLKKTIVIHVRRDSS